MGETARSTRAGHASSTCSRMSAQNAPIPLSRRTIGPYVLLAWVYDACNELPYLRFRDDYGTGKTRALLVIGSLCHQAFFACGVSTVSPIFPPLDTFANEQGAVRPCRAANAFGTASARSCRRQTSWLGRGTPSHRRARHRTQPGFWSPELGL